MNAARALFGRLIDHAPTFPPASLPVDEAIEEDRRARASEESWVLARLAWPASRLAELGGEERELTLILDRPVEPWPVPGTGHVRAVEGRVVPDEVAGAVPEAYVESGDLDEIAARGLRAKIRCGGERVPTVGELGEFIGGCSERGIPFKATAGLHHAVRAGGEHGFLNILAASVFGESALEEEDAAAFRVTDGKFFWRDRSAAPGRGLFVAFGSCSFFEPVEELKALGLI